MTRIMREFSQAGDQLCRQVLGLSARRTEAYDRGFDLCAPDTGDFPAHSLFYCQKP